MFCMYSIYVVSKKQKMSTYTSIKKCIHIETKHSNRSIITSMQANEQISKGQVTEKTFFVEFQFIAVRNV